MMSDEGSVTCKKPLGWFSLVGTLENTVQVLVTVGHSVRSAHKHAEVSCMPKRSLCLSSTVA